MSIYYTQSLKTSGIVAGSVTGVLVGILIAIRIKKVVEADSHIEHHSQEGVICERCGSPMIIRTGPHGEFYGCSNFPQCRNTKPIKTKYSF